MDFANLMGDPGVKKNPLGGCRFSSIDMRHDADVAVAI
jgi:hypothetical protein